MFHLRVTVRSCKTGKVVQEACRRFMSSESGSQKTQTPSFNELPRPGGITTFMRLPYVTDPTELDVAFVGIPMDHGTSNRSGARHGPRQIREESVFFKGVNLMTGAAPFKSLNIGDIGDVPVNLYSLKKAVKIIREYYTNLLSKNVIPLTLGGDHTLTYPILQAMKDKYGPVALIHVDAHLDTTDTMMGMKIAHGTPFRRCIDEELLKCDKVYQIGIRGSGFSMEDIHWTRKQGFKVITADQCWHKSLAPLMDEVRQNLAGQPVYLSFDIDALDPGFAPGTGTLEMAGLTPPQAVEIVKGCKGLNLIGCDLVEVSPPYDPHGTTAQYGAGLLFEMLCNLPGMKYEE